MLQPVLHVKIGRGLDTITVHETYEFIHGGCVRDALDVLLETIGKARDAKKPRKASFYVSRVRLEQEKLIFERANEAWKEIEKERGAHERAARTLSKLSEAGDAYR